MATTVRQGTMDDFRRLVELDDIATISEDRRTTIRGGLEESRVSVAVMDGVPTGYALLSQHFFGHAFLELLYVQAAARRRGIGSALVGYLVENIDGEKLFTSTNQSNTAMQALLTKLGFEESGVIHNLDPGDPELVYCKRLSAA